jgi:signal transduction histidine kinase
MAAESSESEELKRLRQALREREEQLEMAYARTAMADRKKAELLALLGHELRNPLAPITTALQLMTLSGDKAHARERAVIERQVKHLSRLVDDLLDVARVTRGKVEFKKERFTLQEVVARALEMASPLLADVSSERGFGVGRR